MMSPLREKVDYVRNWFLKADHDLQTAVNERSMSGEILTDTICYHCQQTVEKYLKAFLIWNEVDFKKVHDLVYLQQLCMKIDAEFSGINVMRLTEFGTMLRYPDSFYMPTIDETDKAIETAQKIKELVCKKILNFLK